MGEFETSGLPLSSLAMARDSVCWGKPQCSHIGSVSLRLSQTHLTQSMELLFWGWNASISYPHSGFSYHPSMILVPSSEWNIPPSAIKEMEEMRGSLPSSPLTSFLIPPLISKQNKHHRLRYRSSRDTVHICAPTSGVLIQHQWYIYSSSLCVMVQLK